MADDYLGRKMEEYRARQAAGPRPQRPAATLRRLLLRNRSYRGYDPHFLVRRDQLLRIIGVNTLLPSAMNRQVLRFRPVLADEAPLILPHLRLGGALPELHLPLPGTEPNAFIVVCATVPEDRYVDIDLGISVQSMLLQATEIGLNGIAIGAFDRAAVREALALELEPLLLVAVGRGAERIELVPAHAGESLAYYRRDGIHYVPKLQLDELLLGNREAETGRAQAAESPEAPSHTPCAMNRPILRRWQAADCEALARHLNNRHIWDNCRDALPHPYTRRDAERFIRSAATGAQPIHYCIDVDGEAVGGITFTPGSDVERFSAEAGYWLAEPLWGRGIMTQALQAAVADCFRRSGIVRLQAVVYAGNRASMRVLEKTGFRRCGIRHKACFKNGRFVDCHCYELLREECAPDNTPTIG